MSSASSGREPPPWGVSKGAETERSGREPPVGDAPLLALRYDPGVNKNRRLINFAGFAACAGLLAYALYSQFQLGLDPCPLCIFQRVGVAALGVVFLIAALHHPKGWGAPVYAGLI